MKRLLVAAGLILAAGIGLASLVTVGPSKPDRPPVPLVLVCRDAKAMLEARELVRLNDPHASQVEKEGVCLPMLEGAGGYEIVGTETVSVPAGTFLVSRVRLERLDGFFYGYPDDLAAWQAAVSQVAP